MTLIPDVASNHCEQTFRTYFISAKFLLKGVDCFVRGYVLFLHAWLRLIRQSSRFSPVLLEVLRSNLITHARSRA